MAPIVNGLEAKYKGKVAVRRINADTDPAAMELGISAVPTYIFLDSSGNVIERQVGGNPTALEQGFQKAAGQ